MRALSHYLAVASLLVSTTASAGDASFPQDLVAGRALMKLRGVDARTLVGGDRKVLDAIADRTGVSVQLERPSLLGWGLYSVALRGAASPADEEGTRRLVAALSRDRAVQSAVVDRVLRPLAVPDDPGYPQMWHLDVLGMPAAWDVTTGDSAQRIGVVDTGTLRTHEDLSSKDEAGYDFISNSDIAADGNGRDSNYRDEGDGADCGYGYRPDTWHGSHVAGTILAATNNDRGIAGINHAARLVTARAMGRCGGLLSDIMEAAAWLAGATIDGVPSIGANKVSVMNLSLGAQGSCGSYEQQVIDFISLQGTIFVAAAGNDGGEVGTPANCNGVVGVAAHGPGSTRPLADYSSFGSTIDIVAPGGEIATRAENGVLSSVGPASNTYGFYQGTSMAAPHVTGVISLVQAVAPAMPRDRIVQLMQETGLDCSGCSGKQALRADVLLNAVVAATGSTGSSSSGSAPPPPTGDDAYEENDTFGSARAIGCGAQLTLHAALGDRDWFSVTPMAGSTLRVVLDAQSEIDLDLYLTVGESEASILARSESPSGDEEVEWPANGESVAIFVNPYQQATGDYVLAVQCQESGNANPPPPQDDPVDAGAPAPPPPPGDDVSEPNNTAAEATRIACGSVLELVALDDDFFLVDVMDRQNLFVDVRRGAADVKVQVLDATGGLLSLRTTSDDGEAHVREDNLAGGDYAIHVAPVSAPGGSYVLDVRCETPERDETTAGCSHAATGSLTPALAVLAALGFARRRRQGGAVMVRAAVR